MPLYRVNFGADGSVVTEGRDAYFARINAQLMAWEATGRWHRAESVEQLDAAQAPMKSLCARQARELTNKEE